MMPGATTFMPSVTGPLLITPAMPAPEATTTSRNVPQASDKSRRHSRAPLREYPTLWSRSACVRKISTLGVPMRGFHFWTRNQIILPVMTASSLNL